MLKCYLDLYKTLLFQLQEELDQGISLSHGGVTLRRLVVWTFDPLIRLKTLAALVDVCKGTISKNTWPRSAVGNVSDYRCASDCRSRGYVIDPGPVPYFRGD